MNKVFKKISHLIVLPIIFFTGQNQFIRQNFYIQEKQNFQGKTAKKLKQGVTFFVPYNFFNIVKFCHQEKKFPNFSFEIQILLQRCLYSFVTLNEICPPLCRASEIKKTSFRLSLVHFFLPAIFLPTQNKRKELFSIFFMRFNDDTPTSTLSGFLTSGESFLSLIRFFLFNTFVLFFSFSS